MALPLLLLAVVAVHGLDPKFYQPQITTQAIDGKITATTFALDTPTCVFSGSVTDSIYLLVSYDNASTNIDFTSVTRTTVSSLPRSKLASQNYYIALNTTGDAYVCPTPPGKYSMLRIGDNTACAQDAAFCNGPLPPTTSFRAIFIVFNLNGDQTLTRWSDVITLKSVKDSSTIDTWIGRRSGGMIVITTILSVLLAILLACLIAAFAVGTKDICWRKSLDNKLYEETDFNKLKRYTSHHAPETVQNRI
ncbi:uroplakin-3b-like [Pleurodeles waltl]|uniref:uroplakin-3b-like n=1 Tax=Pleurodeles waltl TaxID=8319 RepID=UPI0037093C43